MEDQWLIHRCKQGRQAAFRKIYAKYRDLLLKVSVSIVHDAQAAEDIVHDVFVAFAENMGDFRLTGSLKAYLSVCAANRAKNHLRSRDHRHSPLEKVDMQDNRDWPDAQLLYNEQMTQLAEAMSQLPFEQRQVIALRHFGQMGIRAIAQALDISENTVKSRYRYGMDKLRTLLNSEVAQ